MKTIYISRAGQSLNLKLRQSGSKAKPTEELTTLVDPGDIVRWELDKDSGLTEITGIKESDNNKKKYRGSQNLLEGEPQKKGDVWEGKILSQSPGSEKFENYMIGFKIPNDPEEYWYDPKLQMR
ncbi:hypothetical protein FHG64_01385 [Antarcticibacterium flavum]|uniref:Uncharacterized protein n=1 Tax=Antarcticibacterium flavum TaxID=2058175 RepID=A0A5B7WYV7_9FLAO|nr:MULTISPECIES: hypothetical protein [Antarcticibacterium]MCM4158899.1 hypothetical protein [Antarcticibacterium sp. W02-3]QCY68155.1 hypothetical protein FHG64_01385 [Antarcticibacterium flavum]